MRACIAGAEASLRSDRASNYGRKWSALAATLLMATGFGLGSGETRAANETYTYDNAGRLITVDHGDGRTTNYALDPAGNRSNSRTDVAGAPGALSLGIASGTYPETQGTITVPVKRVGGVTGAVSASIAASFSGTANSSDASVSPASLSWAAGEWADKNVTVTIVDDAANEPNETFSLVISAPTGGATLGTPASIVFTIAASDAVESTPPTNPSSLAGTAQSATQINLTWTASTDASGIAEYRIFRCTGSGCSSWAQVGTSTTNAWNNTSLAEATTYRYRVRAVDGVGNLSASYSNIVTVATLDVTAPGAPPSNTISWYNATRADVTWTAASDNVAVTGYRVYRCQNAGCTNYALLASVSPTASPMTYIDTTLTQMTTYRYVVRAIDAGNRESGNSPIAQVTTTDGTPPSSPVFTSANVISPNRIDLVWSTSTDNVGVTGYRLYRNTAPVTTTTGTSFTDDVLQPQTEYTYTVSAIDAAHNESQWSAPVTRVTPNIVDAQAPSVPTGLAAQVISANRVDLTWGASTDSGGSGLAGYYLYRNGGLYVTLPVSTTPSYSDTGTTGEQLYSYTVYAFDNATPVNVSGVSNTANAQTVDQIAPTAPSGLTATAISSTVVNLAWSPSTDQGGSPSMYYQVYRNSAPVSTGTVTHPGTTWQDTSARAATTYTYTVVARDSRGNESPHSNSASATTSGELSVGVSATQWTWIRTASFPIIQDPAVVATASGGAGGYTYLWERISGDTSTTATTGTVSSTRWTRTMPAGDYSVTSSWRCKVTDSLGGVIYTPAVAVTFIRNTTN